MDIYFKKSPKSQAGTFEGSHFARNEHWRLRRRKRQCVGKGGERVWLLFVTDEFARQARQE
jgi:hypothetical protein